MIDKLEFLLALAREQHFGRAAEACGVPPSEPAQSGIDRPCAANQRRVAAVFPSTTVPPPKKPC